MCCQQFRTPLPTKNRIVIKSILPHHKSFSLTNFLRWTFGPSIVVWSNFCHMFNTTEMLPIYFNHFATCLNQDQACELYPIKISRNNVWLKRTSYSLMHLIFLQRLQFFLLLLLLHLAAHATLILLCTAFLQRR